MAVLTSWDGIRKGWNGVCTVVNNSQSTGYTDIVKANNSITPGTQK